VNLLKNRLVLGTLLQLVRPDFNENTWAAFEMQAIQERPAIEIANALGMTKNAVLCARSRVLNRLRREAKGLAET
jgi:RNA polymerase sigma-70 factor (ECF subfamily)